MLPGELAQSLCSALASAWHIHSMGRPPAASVAHSLVTEWIRSVSTLACPSERCAAPLQTRAIPFVSLVSDCPEARPRPHEAGKQIHAQPNTGWQYRCHCITRALHSRVSTGKHVQRQQGPKKGSRALYPDGIPWRHLSTPPLPACALQQGSVLSTNCALL